MSKKNDIGKLLLPLVTDPERLSLLNTIIENPINGLRSLDMLIRDRSTDAAGRKNYRNLRDKLENWYLER